MKRFLSILLLLCIIMASVLVSSCDGDASEAPSATIDISTTEALSATAATTADTDSQKSPSDAFCSHDWDGGKSETFACGTKLTHTCKTCQQTRAEISASGSSEHKFNSKNICSVCGIDKVTVNGISLSKFVIVYGNDSYSKSIATSLKNKIKAVKGYSLTTKSVSEEESEYEILIGKTNRADTKEFFDKGTSFTNENYEFKISDKKIALAATSEELVELAKKKFFERFLVEKGELRLTTDMSFKGDKHNVDERINDTDIRIASNNIYLHGTPANRKTPILNLVDKMDADVLMLQEVTSTWHSLLDSSLVSRGYTAVPTSAENISGVTANDNYTPIWYRSGKVELLKYGYDQFESVQYKPDSYLSSSKSYTWALFRDKNTNKQFVCISTHFTWAPDNFNPSPNQLRVDDANEIKAFVLELQREYGEELPIIVAGDLNCAQGSDPYNVLNSVMDSVRTNGNLKRGNNLNYATIHDLGKLPAVSGYVIDHTFVSGSGYAINQYQHVINEYSLNGSDHLPLIVDIAFDK